jgi:hypothetical protein
LLEKEINAYRAWRYWNWKNCLRSITTTLLANFFTRVSVCLKVEELYLMGRKLISLKDF